MGMIFGRSTSAKDRWNAAKKAFETATGKKKPSKMFLGSFRKSSGIESAIDDLDQIGLLVWDAKTQKDYDKAKASYLKGAEKLKKAAQAYIKVLESAGDGEYKAFKAEVDKLKDALMKQVTSMSTDYKNRNDFK